MPLDLSKIRTKQETTFVDLKATDMIVDKAGQAWPLADLTIGETTGVVAFWLCDQVTKIKTHFLNENAEDPVTVLRLNTHADQLAKAEREVPKTDEPPIMEADAVKAIRARLDPDAEVEAVVTAEEVDAAIVATDTQEPTDLLSFDDMTDLEKRSHLYSLHGIFALDVQPRATLAEMHDKAHSTDRPSSKFVPHEHKAGATK